jgi:hypothetical protein
LGKNNADLGMGNPLSVNQLIAHHAVVFKPSELMVWVSAAPYQLGKFVAYDMNKIFSLTKEDIGNNTEIYSADLTIPADSFLLSDEYSAFNKYLLMSDELNRYSREEKDLPASFEESYIESNPMYYLTYSRLGDHNFNIKDYKKAYNYYQMALTREVAGEDIRKEIERLSDESLKRSQNAEKGN